MSLVHGRSPYQQRLRDEYSVSLTARAASHGFTTDQDVVTGRVTFEDRFGTRHAFATHEKAQDFLDEHLRKTMS